METNVRTINSLITHSTPSGVVQGYVLRSGSMGYARYVLGRAMAVKWLSLFGRTDPGLVGSSVGREKLP